ncbi:MAG: imelysin family protein [Hyphomicrobiaceae bacterium]|nr:imelysin family protein [Hyphomicrobiaceae bacterium]
MKSLASLLSAAFVAAGLLLQSFTVEAGAVDGATNASKVGRDPAAAKSQTLPERHASTVESTVEAYVLSRYTELKLSTGMLAHAVQAWCASEQASAPEPVRDAYKSVVRVWAGVDYYRFGPARDANRLQRIMFWPDPRGVIRKQVSRVLAAKDESLSSAPSIATQSAALQGLPALEQLIFAERSGETADDARYRCRLAAAVAGNVAQLSNEMVEEWQKPDGWRHLMENPGAENSTYKSEVEAVSELYRALLAGLQIVAEQVMPPWLKAAESGKSWGGLPFETSGLTTVYVGALIESLDDLGQSLHLAEVAQVIGASAKDKAWMASWIANAFASMARDIPTLVEPRARAGVKFSAGELEALRRVKFHANGMRQLIGREIAGAAGASIGFNELDGD